MKTKNENSFWEVSLVLTTMLLFVFNAFLALKKMGGL